MLKVTDPKKLLLVIIGSGLLGILLFFAFLQYTKQPSFCTSCHFMQPYYDSWKSSTHYGKAVCVDCHYHIGFKREWAQRFRNSIQVVKAVTDNYPPKPPKPDIDDKACMRPECHASKKKPEKVNYKGVIFDHQVHYGQPKRGITLHCNSCHTQMFRDKHMSIEENVCFLCHFKGVPAGDLTAKCTICHTPPKKVVTWQGKTFDHEDFLKQGIACTRCHFDITEGTGKVAPERCWQCHNVEEYIERTSDHDFMMGKHVTQRHIDCFACHEIVKHKFRKGVVAASLECSNCHAGHHNYQQLMFSGKGGKGVEDLPDPMFKTGLNCTACHKGKPTGGEFPRADVANCNNCHGQGYDKQARMWQESTKADLEKVRTAIEYADTIFSGKEKGRDYGRARALFNEALENYQFVVNDRSNGIHNPLYANRLLAKAVKDLDEAVRLMGGASRRVSVVLPDNECATRCHRGMRADKVYQRKEGGFLHAPHFTKGFPCEKCHVAGRHGLPGVKADCKSCHHDRKVVGQQPPCQGCHPAQNSMVRGTGGAGIKDNPGLMPKQTCLSCHFKEGENVRPTSAACGSCHPATHVAMMPKWQDTVRKAIARIQPFEKAANEAAQKGRLNEEAAEEVRKASQNMNFVLTDKTMGVHNVAYTDQLLNYSEKMFKEALGQARK